MKVEIRPGLARGTVAAPPSKSYAHRLMLCAALAQGTSTVRGVAQSEDMGATLDCISSLGAQYALDGDILTVRGTSEPLKEGTCFPCRESGSTLRFFLPLALVKGSGAVFTGTRRLMERGVSVYETLFAEKSIVLQKSSESLTVSGRLTPGTYTLRGDVSSQFVTGLLFALPLLDSASVLQVLPPVESRPYIDITLDAMRIFGVTVTEGPENTFHIPGGQSYRPMDVTVEGDWSNAATLLVLNELGGDVTVTGLHTDSLQGDRVCVEYLRRLSNPEAVLDLSGCPDLGPVLFAVAAANHGAVFTGTRRLKIKESDRAQVMAEELKKFGVFAEVEENTVRIPAGGIKTPDTILHGHTDHRVIMALSLLASQVGGVIIDAEAVRKSYPDFFRDLKRLGLEVTYGTE